MNKTSLSLILVCINLTVAYTSSGQDFPQITSHADLKNQKHGAGLRAAPDGADRTYSAALAATTAAASGVPAFPGAEGYGAASSGGRGGTVYEVTNLNDSGSGSLRAGAEASGPRTIVFRTGGTILLQSKIDIEDPFITIAGQTAPGDGVTIATDPSYTGPAFSIKASDVVIRYLRIRPGPSTTLTNGIDAVSILSGSRIILDHCSLSWATDEVLSTANSPSDITVQWSIIAEGLQNSTHIEGAHSRGALLGSIADNLSFHHNLMAHNYRRNPKVNSYQIADVVNNVIYNWGEHAVHIEADDRPIHINVVGNYALSGADTERLWMIVYTGGQGAELYAKGNIGPTRLDDGLPEEDAVDPDDRIFLVAQRHPAPMVTTTTAAEAYTQVLNLAGATLPARDVVDQRIVNDVINRTGGIIDDPSHVGGWPEMAAGTPPADSDHDGMPDWWEEAHGLNPNNASDGPLDSDQDGYTNLEHYLNSLTQQGPHVYAGPDQTVTLPAAANLNGTAFDDGLPNPPGALEILWTAVSGPGVVSFGDASALQTTADLSQPGEYSLRLSASDGEFTSTDDVAVLAVLNQAPTVNAGADAVVVFPAGVDLDGSVSDDGAPNPPGAVTTNWGVASGPGTVTFGDAAAIDTTATFATTGTYVLRLTADDNATSAYDEVNVTVLASQGFTKVEARVSAGEDDAEESASGSVGLTSSDLELVHDGGDQVVGIRFRDLEIPNGAAIVAAYIQFRVDEATSEATSLLIQAQSADDAPLFSSSSNNISARERTAAAIPWAVAPWTSVGQAGPDQRSPDIAPVIQEVVGRAGWSAGRALAVIITGTGERVAESFNGDPSGAPLLYVEYTIPESPSLEADLSVEISDSPDPVTAGEEITYTVTVTNVGPNQATGVVATSVLPPDVSLISTTGCAESPGIPQCTLEGIAPDASKTFTVTVDTSAEGTVTYQGSVSGTEPDPNSANDSAAEQTTVNIANQPPEVTITAPSGGAAFSEFDSVTFNASANDPEQGDISLSLIWASSIDGRIGGGGSFATSALSSGSHTITASVSDTAGLTGSDSISITVNPFSGISLSVEGYKDKGLHKASIIWSGATSTMIDIYRNNSLLTTTLNDGFFTDDIDGRGRGSYQYRICETGGGACSESVSAEF